MNLNINPLLRCICYLCCSLTFCVQLQAQDLSSNGMKEPFTYSPVFSSDFKKMKVDNDGIIVVTSNRFNMENLPQQHRLVIYSLDHSRSLIWLFEDDQEKIVYDSVITADAIYVLHSVISQPHPTEVSKYNRLDGSLAWHQPINGSIQLNPDGEIKNLKVNPISGTLAVATVVDDITHIWWFDLDGNPVNHWSADVAPFTGSLGSGFEKIGDFELLDDNSVLLVLTIDSGLSDIMLLKVADDQVLFTYSPEDTFIVSGNDTPRLTVSTDQHYFVSYAEEDMLGIPRLKQFILNQSGEEVFIEHHNNLHKISAQGTEHMLHHSGKLLNVALEDDPADTFHIFQTDSNGVQSDGFTYNYLGAGHSESIQHIALGDNNELFMVGRFNNPFPDVFSDTLYLMFDPTGQLCQELEVDGVDFYAQVQYFQSEFYELRYMGENVMNGLTLHVIKHKLPKTCQNDIIFLTGFESIIN